MFVDNRTDYEKRVQDRSWIRYIIGLIVRWKANLKYAYARRVARKNGASIGEGVIMSLSLAKRLNKNVTIGNHVSIQTENFSSFRWPLTIKDNVIIGSNVKIVMGGHNIDSLEFENIRNNSGLVIEEYVWLCPDSVILPSVEKISYGSIVGANSVVVKNTSKMAVVSGNPAKELRERKSVHQNLVVESLLGGDYAIYKLTRKNKK